MLVDGRHECLYKQDQDRLFFLFQLPLIKENRRIFLYHNKLNQRLHHNVENQKSYRILQSLLELHQILIFEKDQFCLITEEAKDNISEIHHRQPVIIKQTDVNRYLNLDLQGSIFLKECNKPDLIFHEVSKDVNKPTNNYVDLIQSV